MNWLDLVKSQSRQDQYDQKSAYEHDILKTYLQLAVQFLRSQGHRETSCCQISFLRGIFLPSLGNTWTYRVSQLK